MSAVKEHFERSTSAPTLTYTEYERSEGVELIFDEPVDQESDEPLDSVNNALWAAYGETATIDWRDEYTCWVY